MLEQDLSYTQKTQGQTLPKSQENLDYYKKQNKFLQDKLFHFEKENERLIQENSELLDKNYKYNDILQNVKLSEDSKNYNKKLENDYQSLIKHTKVIFKFKILTQDMKQMVGKVNKAQEIILGLKRTGHTSMKEILDTMDHRLQTIKRLEAQVAACTQSEKFAKDDLMKTACSFSNAQTENEQLKKLLDDLKTHHNNVNDDNQLLIKKLRSEIKELQSKNLYLEQNTRNTQKFYQKVVEDHVSTQQALNLAQQKEQHTQEAYQQLTKDYVSYQEEHPTDTGVEIKRQRRFVLY